MGGRSAERDGSVVVEGTHYKRMMRTTKSDKMMDDHKGVLHIPWLNAALSFPVVAISPFEIMT